MTGPSWLADLFAAMMLVIAGYCAVRLAVAGARRRESELDADAVHLLMGVAMAGMLASALSIGLAAVWEAVFAAAAAWFAWQAVRGWRGYGAGRWRCPYPLPHLAECLAMVYMLIAIRTSAPGVTGAGMSGMGGSPGMARAPELAAVFALFMVGYVAWMGDRLTAIGAVTPAIADRGAASLTMGAARQSGGCWPVLAPRGAACSKIAMGITMGYMLIIML